MAKKIIDKVDNNSRAEIDLKLVEQVEAKVIQKISELFKTVNEKSKELEDDNKKEVKLVPVYKDMSAGGTADITESDDDDDDEELIVDSKKTKKAK